MNALIVINSQGQDEVLGSAFDAEMKEKSWITNDFMPLVYMKEFDKTITQEEIRKKIIEDIDNASYESEWSNVAYLYNLSNNEPVFEHSAP